MGTLTIPPPPPGGYEQSIPIELQGQVTMIATSALALILPTVLVGLRIYAKRLSSRGYDWADYTIILALLCNYGMQTTGWLLVTHGGLGFPIEVVLTRFGPDVGTFFYESIIVLSVFWNFTTLLSKLSMLFLFQSIMPVRGMRIPARAIMGFVVVTHTCYIIAQFTLCRPFPESWNPVVNGQCKSINLYYFIMGFTNIIADVVILILPMPFIFKLKLAKSKKFSLVAVFAVGFISCTLAIYRQIVLPELTFDDLTGSGLTATVFSGLEPAVAIALSCVPYLRLLFIHRSSKFIGTISPPPVLPYVQPSKDDGFNGLYDLKRLNRMGSGTSGLTSIDRMSEENPSELALQLNQSSSEDEEKPELTTAAAIILAARVAALGATAAAARAKQSELSMPRTPPRVVIHKTVEIAQTIETLPSTSNQRERRGKE